MAVVLLAAKYGICEEMKNQRTKPLSAKRAREVLRYNKRTGEFHWRTDRGTAKKDDLAGCYDAGYYTIGVDGGRYSAHRLAWLIVTGAWPKGQVDHKNGDKLDNRFKNLRDVTQFKNLQNQKLTNRKSASGLLGAYSARNRFRSVIMINGKKINLGRFDTAQEAHEAYKREAFKNGRPRR